MDDKHWRFVSTLLPAYFSYHAEKERMAYAAAALHVVAMLTGAIGRPFWTEHPQLVVFALIIESGAAFFYVSWQLEQRRDAATFVGALLNIATKWTATPPTDESLRPVAYKGYKWPSDIAKEFAPAGEAVKGDLRVSIVVTYLMMGLSSLAFGLAVIGAFLSAR
jgi:hypothetical protein